MIKIKPFLYDHHFFFKQNVGNILIHPSVFGSTWLIHEIGHNVKQIVLELNLIRIQLISLINFIKQNFNACENFQLSKNKCLGEKQGS